MSTSCSRTNRWVRGGIGAVAGGVAGGVLGFGLSLLFMKDMADTSAAGGMPSPGTMMAFVFGPLGTGILGIAAGATIGAWKPDCDA